MDKIIRAFCTDCLAMIGTDRRTGTLNLVRNIIFAFLCIQKILQPNHPNCEIQEFLFMYIVTIHFLFAPLVRNHAAGVAFITHHSLFIHSFLKVLGEVDLANLGGSIVCGHFFHIMLHHQFDELLKTGLLRIPTQFAFGFARVTQ